MARIDVGQRGEGREGGGFRGGMRPQGMMAVPRNHPFFNFRFNRFYPGFRQRRFFYLGQMWCWYWWVDQWMLAPCPEPFYGGFPGYGAYGWPGYGLGGGYPWWSPWNQSFSEWQWGAAPFYGYGY